MHILTSGATDAVSFLHIAENYIQQALGKIGARDRHACGFMASDIGMLTVAVLSTTPTPSN
jgi:hypothetical protein